MKIALTMPQFGESITKARIVRWLKQEGETINESEPLVEMETEKSVFAYESPFRGKIVKILEKEEKEIAIGVEIAHFEVSDQDGRKYLSLGAGKDLSARSVGPPMPAASAAPKSTPSGIRVLPLNPIRARIADNMVLSKKTIPHAGSSVDVDLTAIEEWRSRQKEAPGYLLFTILATLKALKKYKALNSSWKESEGKRWIEEYDFIHLGLALSTDQGLLVPVIRNADNLSPMDLNKEINRLVEAGRKGALKVEELTGGTLTLNNTGALGAMRSEQIIPHPQAAILATNRAMRRPWVVDDKIEIRLIMSLDLAFDHRIIDGDQAVRFLLEVRENLEKFDFNVF